MELTGRITANATVHNFTDGRTVTNFSIAINDRFKRKGDAQFTELTTYVNCAYWRNANITQFLTKGRLVQLYGRISINVYNNTNGEAKGSLQFHVNDLKFLGGSNNNSQSEQTASIEIMKKEKEDLPF